MSIGEKIRNLRKARDWSQEDLSQRIHMNRLAISRWESGFAQPDADEIVALCQVFGLTADYLLTDSAVPVLMTTAEKKRIHRHATGTVCAVLAVVMLVALAVVSWIDPWVYSNEAGSYEGLAGYVLAHNLQWLVVCIAVLLVGGVVLLLSSSVKKNRKKTR